MKLKNLFFLLLFFSTWLIQAQSEPNVSGKSETKKERKEKAKQDSIRQGWTFGILPSISYDADYGLQLGVLTQIFNFGDGSTYPQYLHSLYIEASYTTKRYGIFRFKYDSKYLIAKHRFMADVSYIPDATSDFYGFNGYQSVYHADWINDQHTAYQSRIFYKHQKDILRIAADLEGTIYKNLKWSAGLGLLGFMVNKSNVSMLNKGKKDSKKLPENVEGLYEKYCKWELLDPEETSGGWHPYLRAGITFDSKDKEQNPNRGICANAFLTYSAAFGKQSKFNSLTFNALFSHYIPVYKKWITFAYRIGTQLNVVGQAPYYLNNYWNMINIQRVLYDGLGGANSLRGVLRNRILSNGFAVANIEFRFKAWSFSIKKEQFYLGFNAFCDAGMVLQPYSINKEKLLNTIRLNDPSFDLNTLNDYILFENTETYRPHLSAGLGLKAVMNDNFVLSVEWAFPFDKRDNQKMGNIYIKVGYMF